MTKRSHSGSGICRLRALLAALALATGIAACGQVTQTPGTVTASSKNPMKAAIQAAFDLEPGPADAARGGLRFCTGYFSRAQQEALVAALRQVVERAPLYTARMPKS